MLKKIVLVVLSVALLFVALVLILVPRKVSVSRSTSINAGVSKVYPFVGNLRNWEKWSPWYKQEPTAEFKYAPNARSGMSLAGNGQNADYFRVISGSWYTWKGDIIKEGKLTIMNASQEGLITKVEFKGMGESQGTWSFEPDGATTNVTWGFNTDLGMNPINRLFGYLMMESALGKDFDSGLASLKELAEAEQAKASGGGSPSSDAGDDSNADDADEAGAADAEDSGDAAESDADAAEENEEEPATP